MDNQKFFNYDANANQIGTELGTGQKDIKVASTKADADAQANSTHDSASVNSIEADLNSWWSIDRKGCGYNYEWFT